MPPKRSPGCRQRRPQAAAGPGPPGRLPAAVAVGRLLRPFCAATGAEGRASGLPAAAGSGMRGAVL